MSKRSDIGKLPVIIERYKAIVDRRLRAHVNGHEPASVYGPIRHILNAGGKRLRAVLLLLASEAVGGKSASALDAACAIELLHTFTLVHDDVMDKSDLRRGVPTIHTKWDVDTAILSGDQIAACAHAVLLNAKTTKHKEIFQVFANAFVEVCEGQGYDKNFESRIDVDVEDYLMMIEKKTARMISASTEIGAIIGGGTVAQIKALRQFGKYIGLAFQIQDDILDIDGEEKTFGKAIGRDIIEGKRTYLLLTALDRTKGADRRLMESVMQHRCVDKGSVKRVRDIYERKGVLSDARKEVDRFTTSAQRELRVLPENRAVSALLRLSGSLLRRQS
jgi:geranylgeranyl diphosphate synthase, type II